MINIKLTIVALSLIALVSCGGSASVDFTNPESVVQAMFDAASSGEMEVLSTLCDPKGENDGDTKDVCSCGDKDVDSEMLESYKEYFAKGKVTNSKVDGDKAKVEFTFGPDGTKKETMNLVKRDGKWYLSSF